MNAFNQNRGAGAVFRTIPSKVLTIEDLGMGQIFKDICEYPRGIVLVTGPTGSGKSTTLAAMLDYINDNRYDHILTVEDQSNLYTNQKCLINQREVHRDTHGFNEALRSALREDRILFWSVRCVTLKPSVWHSLLRKPVTWSSVPCIPPQRQNH